MPAAAALGPGRLLRPLLEVPRAALRAYAAAAALPFAADPMNSELRYDRAYLRARLWPALSERWPQAAATLARSAAHLAVAQRLLDGASARALGPLRRGPALEVAGLLGVAPAERGELLRFWLAEQGLRAPPARRQGADRARAAARARRRPATHDLARRGAARLCRFSVRICATRAARPRRGSRAAGGRGAARARHARASGGGRRAGCGTAPARRRAVPVAKRTGGERLRPVRRLRAAHSRTCCARRGCRRGRASARCW